MILFASALLAVFSLQSFEAIKKKKIARYLMKDKCYTYEYQRRYLTDSEYVETYFNVINKVKLMNDTFRISNGVWYYCLDGKFEILFNKKMFDNKEISRLYSKRVSDSSYLLLRESHIAYEPLYKTRYKNREVWVYYFYVWGTRTTINDYYPDKIYFDPEYGIVKTEVQGCGISEMKV